MSINLLLELLLNGLMIGAVYALFAIGLALMFGVLEFVNFAHGEFYMLGAMVTATLVHTFGLDYWLTVPIVLLAGAVAGVAFYDLLLKRLRQGDFEKSILITIGLAMVLQNGALFIWSPTPVLLNTSFVVSVVEVGGLVVPVTRIIALVVAVTALVVVYVGLNFTRAGLALRGVAQNREAALMVGIPPQNVSRLAVSAGIALCCLSGAVLALIYTIFPTMGVLLVFKAFAIVIIGGLGSIVGAAVVGFGIGFLESFLGLFYGAATANIMIFSAMILLLLFRPLGLFGRRVRI
ncbi:MAG: branched-chain amino acid ABC transporter permease [Hyphomicrobiaceae bacterium]